MSKQDVLFVRYWLALSLTVLSALFWGMIFAAMALSPHLPVSWRLGGLLGVIAVLCATTVSVRHQIARVRS